MWLWMCSLVLYIVDVNYLWYMCAIYIDVDCWGRKACRVCKSACTCRSTLYVWTGQCTARACAWATPITNISECHCQKEIGGAGGSRDLTKMDSPLFSRCVFFTLLYFCVSYFKGNKLYWGHLSLWLQFSEKSLLGVCLSGRGSPCTWPSWTTAGSSDL